jgi:hypothetical protein
LLTKHHAEDMNMQIIRNSFTPSPELQQQLETFHASRLAYLEEQDVYTATVKETSRLEQAAEALEAEAEEANSSWKAMAKDRHADQRKINAEVERSVQLKTDAEKFRRTASVREELHSELIVRLAEARAEASHWCNAVRSRYMIERIQALLATEGLAELLGELHELVEYGAQAEGYGSLMGELKAKDFGSLLATVVKQGAEPITLFSETALPTPVTGEVLALGGIELEALRQSNGQTTSIIRARRRPTN